MSRHQQQNEGDGDVLPTHELSDRARQWSRVPEGFVRVPTPRPVHGTHGRDPDGGERGDALDLENRSREELFRIAKYLMIEGRTSMTKDELLARIRAML